MSEHLLRALGEAVDRARADRKAGTLTLTEFLLARIAEDEAAAKVAEGRRWSRDGKWRLEGVEHDVIVSADLRRNEIAFTGPDEVEHIARHDPARVLAECEAKRRIVEVVTGWKHATVEDCWYSCAATYGTDVENACCNDAVEGTGCDCGLDFRVRSILAPAAAVYADHPDYNPEWRP